MISNLSAFFATILSFSVFAQKIPKIENATIIATCHGNLDEDHHQELAIVYHLQDIFNEEEGSVDRILVLFKKKNNKWIEWMRSNNAIHTSEENQLNGDPFINIAIRNKLLIIEHEGTTNKNWFMKESYKISDSSFTLIDIEAKEEDFCQELIKLNVNFMSGFGTIEKIKQKCSEGSSSIVLSRNKAIFFNVKETNNIEAENVQSRFKSTIEFAFKQQSSLDME